MLKLSNIVKEYVTGDLKVEALKGVGVTFRDNEFVSILGQSGCGKTTMLNIIGGLDHYTSGDLIINGVSTKEYKDRNWDMYRNNSVGFVFQSYNLIPHQTVLANVELALTLSGVSRKERRQRAIDALNKVGLGDQLNKKPNQMSGGQMQRVAIARAIVNDPDILLADEPTGALDTQTSVQVMEILKEISKDRLIIMVTHNPELAEKYSSRIIRLLDGKITDDSDPYDAEVELKKADDRKTVKQKSKKKSMSFLTALSLSFNNLLTKKGRTFMTAFAGSIGIIGIALILSLSHGVQQYIDDVQRDTLASYPVTIEKETMDVGSMVEAMTGQMEDVEDHSDEDKIYSSDIMVDLMSTMTAEMKSNNLKAFKKYIEDNDDKFSDEIISNIQYTYDVPINIYTENENGTVTQVNPSKVFDNMGQTTGQENLFGTADQHMQMSGMNVFRELYNSEEMLEQQYDVIAGKWPEKENEVVLIADVNNQVSDFALYSIGMKDQNELTEIMKALMAGESYETKQVNYTFDEILRRKFRLVLPTDYYSYDKATKQWVDKSEDDFYMTSVVTKGMEISVVGIIRPDEDSKTKQNETGGIGYTSKLTRYVIDSVNNSDIVKQQNENKDVDVFTGIPFEMDEESMKVTMEVVKEYMSKLPLEEQEQYKTYMQSMSEEQIITMFKKQMEANTTEATYEGNLTKLGVCDLSDPKTINIYAKGFEQKDTLSELIKDYNNEVEEEDKIEYTDYIALMMSSVTTIINAISYILIAFVAISLIVSSIMIGIITYISVLERTKEIGILRAIGASKKDVSRVFNAETMIVGFTAGLIGIIVTLLMLIPINSVINHLTDIRGLAKLPLAGGVSLVIISVVLTLIAGLMPSNVAAKKDPVEALRSE